jgi:hypothetical protein
MRDATCDSRRVNIELLQEAGKEFATDSAPGAMSLISVNYL